ncbi:YbaK/aminoacyl-tRNA synthetase-associated domain-containing protein [Dissophora ornata]|nr:YbaK/aminoacyl-tRNA synthetase-associated domain-containing protein [Dissophora ornata]
MPEPTTATASGTQLMADASPEPVLSLEDFLSRVYKDAHGRLPRQCRFFHVATDYYDWPYEQRARVMACPSTFHLCKTLVFENTKWKQDETKPVDADRYWCVIVQYEGSVNITKLEKAVREKTGSSRKGMHLRIAPAEKSHELTGFINNAVSPVGMKTDLPILISTAIAELSPPVFYLGAGHIDWKIALPVQSFVDNWNASVIDFS